MLYLFLIASVILIAFGAGALGEVVWIIGLALFGISLVVRFIAHVSAD
jgi:hypothetical protein